MLARAEALGYLDDSRFARERALALAARGYGDAYIRADLDRRGVGAGTVDEALAGLEPEAERALRLASRLGGGLRAARALARKGFGADALETACTATLREGPGEV